MATCLAACPCPRTRATRQTRSNPSHSSPMPRPGVAQPARPPQGVPSHVRDLSPLHRAHGLPGNSRRGPQLQRSLRR